MKTQNQNTKSSISTSNQKALLIDFIVDSIVIDINKKYKTELRDKDIARYTKIEEDKVISYNPIKKEYFIVSEERVNIAKFNCLNFINFFGIK